MTTADKIEVVRTVVENITIDRKSRNMAVITITNKITGEKRTLECNTWKCEIIKMRVELRPTI